MYYIEREIHTECSPLYPKIVTSVIIGMSGTILKNSSSSMENLDYYNDRYGSEGCEFESHIGPTLCVLEI